jgi:hypothetical protein
LKEGLGRILREREPKDNFSVIGLSGMAKPEVKIEGIPFARTCSMTCSNAAGTTDALTLKTCINHEPPHTNAWLSAEVFPATRLRA